MMKFHGCAMTAVVLLATAGAAHAAQLVVIDAKGSISKTTPIGSVIDDANLDVQDHDQLTVMTATGETIQVDGPHKGPVGAPTGGDPGMLQKLSNVMKDRQASFGATRNVMLQTDPGEHKADPWAIDASFSSTACVFEGRPAQLFLPKSANASSVTVKDETSGKSATIDWPTDGSNAAWPASLPAVDGDQYTVSFGASHRTLTVKKVSAATSEGMGSLLAAGAGCNGQAKDLARAAKPVKAS